MSYEARDQMWAIWDAEDEDMPPMAIFPTEREAHAYMILMQLDQGCLNVVASKADVTVFVPDEPAAPAQQPPEGAK